MTYVYSSVSSSNSKSLQSTQRSMNARVSLCRHISLSYKADWNQGCNRRKQKKGEREREIEVECVACVWNEWLKVLVSGTNQISSENCSIPLSQSHRGRWTLHTCRTFQRPRSSSLSLPTRCTSVQQGAKLVQPFSKFQNNLISELSWPAGLHLRSRRWLQVVLRQGRRRSYRRWTMFVITWKPSCDTMYMMSTAFS